MVTTGKLACEKERHVPYLQFDNQRISVCKMMAFWVKREEDRLKRAHIDVDR
jgi:hypothetical protein